MQFLRFPVVFGLLMVALSCSGHIGGHNSYQDIDPRKYCGRNLARIIADICSYEKDASEEKRSDAGTMYGLMLPPYYKQQELPSGWPWIEPHKAKSLSLPSRGKRFIVEECCLKSCSIGELMSYC